MDLRSELNFRQVTSEGESEKIISHVLPFTPLVMDLNHSSTN